MKRLGMLLIAGLVLAGCGGGPANDSYCRQVRDGVRPVTNYAVERCGGYIGTPRTTRPRSYRGCGRACWGPAG